MQGYWQRERSKARGAWEGPGGARIAGHLLTPYLRAHSQHDGFWGWDPLLKQQQHALSQL